MLANERIAVYNTLVDVFGSVEASLPHAKRWNDLADEFEQRFGRKPRYIARAPGRVNLIGEHIDYSLFGVLPAAIDRDILVACAPRASSPAESSTAVVAENLQQKYPKQEFAPTFKVIKTEEGDTKTWFLDIDTSVLRWESYIKAGYYGVLSHCFTDPIHSPVAVDMLIAGSVPSGSGLSSSAALVVASTLAFLAVNGKIARNSLVVTKGQLVELAMLNEKRVGVNSGGMDQAVSVMSNPSSALYITFFPSLAASPVPLPPRGVFVVANSLKVADKLLSARHGYNLRVVETLVAARVLANSLRIRVEDKEKITLREVVERYRRDGDNSDDELDLVLAYLVESDALDVLKSKVIQPEQQFGVTMDEMIEMSGMSKELFHQVYLSWVDVEATHFQLYKRAKHVLSEARRVLQFRKTCLNGSNSEMEVLKTLGRLMNESQESCSSLFECSCGELDQLTRLAKEAGALASRLTGAGWGGCTVSLVLEDEVEGFIRQIRETYAPYKDLDAEMLAEAIFATKPGRGACVFEFG